ncbi:MAG: class I SAM-dependent methyltransferase [Acidobacteria bacterium]|nr:class I SAM-dependent methyltransferase [Acidobacteriota bacterium]
MLEIACRLCGAKAERRFSISILGKYDVALYRCTACESLETEAPHWLDEAYAEKRILHDVGRVQRTQLVAMLCAHLLDGVGLRGQAPMLDWGGAEGMLCRMLRDRGFGFHTYDLYEESPAYALAYRVPDPGAVRPLALTAIEVLEHLAEPGRELAAMFAGRPRYALFTTELYENQDSDWGYLAPMTGKHVFFYSEKAMRWIGERHGYRYYRFPMLHVFAAGNDPAMDALWARRETLYADSAASWTAHMTGPEIWKYVFEDFNEARARFG